MVSPVQYIRWAEVLTFLGASRNTVKELVEACGVSASTIRRDLDQLLTYNLVGVVDDVDVREPYLYYVRSPLDVRCDYPQFTADQAKQLTMAAIARCGLVDGQKREALMLGLYNILIRLSSEALCSLAKWIADGR